MKRKMISVLCTGVMLSSLVLAGCSGGKTAEDKKETGEGKKDDGKYVIGFANASVSNSWRVKMRDMLIEEADKLGVEIVETDAHDDANTQNSNIEAMLQKDLDAILITPAVEDAVNPGIEAAYESGIPVILFDRTATTEDYTHFVGWTDENNGAACAQMVVDAITEKNGEPKGNVIALDSIAGSGTDNGQKAGQEKIFSKYPDIKIIDRQYTDFESSKGKSVMEDFLSKYGKGEIDAVISQDGAVTLAAWDAIVEAGRDDEGIIVVNADGINGVAKNVKDGKFYGFTQFPCAASVEALHLAIDTIEGKDPEEKIVIKDPITVTAENIDEYVIEDGDDFDWTY
ncbi:substrate-binding domain-containing protein [Mediterraneibacter gnavus]|uniref:substrate-binding domain-containing protein n=1 Tax=Mediterraneibacter gnavus TaxID=33038 RepID=UPI00232F0DDC|nr:substrate-binding domain-containing protein [Mediterraneibacter gnavus]MDB8710056.1 substrate-binding domain-containing protein [Mediterraneibacter gnavus]MDB8713475.1 substrate-binding domain-containing protein [Mediterraneibacter gnavus]